MWILTKLSAFKKFHDKYSIPVLSADIKNKIEEIAVLVKKGDLIKATNFFRDLVKCRTKHDTVVIALTEISTILSKHERIVQNKTIIDSLQLLANCVADTYVKGIFDTLYVDKDRELFDFEFLKNDAEKNIIEQELRNILCEIDYEFIPPLSYRDSTTFSFGAKTTDNNNPEEYLQKLLKQEIIICRTKSNNRVVGFMSYIPDYTLEIKNKKIIKCHYITTIGITKGWRGHGLTNQFYRMIEEIVKRQTVSNFVATRTWSTNRTHIKILLDLGYKNVLTIENHRGHGIHTIYFAKKIV